MTLLEHVGFAMGCINAVLLGVLSVLTYRNPARNRATLFLARYFNAMTELPWAKFTTIKSVALVHALLCFEVAIMLVMKWLLP